MNAFLDRLVDRLTKILDWIGSWYNEKWSWGLLLGAIVFEVIWYGVFNHKS